MAKGEQPKELPAATNVDQAQLLETLCLGAFRMPSVQTMMSRKSSITNAFVNSIVPVIPPTYSEISEALAILGLDPSDLRCAYCGDKASE
jgi:hypothetical protein